MSKLLHGGVVCLLLVGILLAAPPVPGRAAEPSTIHLRRGAFDPLDHAPRVATMLQAGSASRLQLVQLDGPPDDGTEARLQAAGMRPLAYIPDNTYLVRVAEDGFRPSAALRGVRWSGPFELAYKLPASLDGLLAAGAPGDTDLLLLGTSDADPGAIAAAVGAAAGSVVWRDDAPNGPAFRVRLPASGLRGIVARDDVLWVERRPDLQILNNEGREIIGVNQTRLQIPGLNGSGQIAAMTDSGLDLQNGLSADFAGRIKRGFSPKEMYSGCTRTDWSDWNGHGTHVSGTVLGSGALSPSGLSFAGVAPAAQLVIQSFSEDGTQVDCLEESSKFLSLAYDNGARVQNGSFGADASGEYDGFASLVDQYLWSKKDHLFVVAAGNAGTDNNRDGTIDLGSLGSPASAKNVLAVGATENNRPPTGGPCASSPTNCTYGNFGITSTPFNTDPISNNPGGMAGFSSRGPAADGRIKPEIVAPGVNIISTASHHPNVDYQFSYNADYAYESGTSMASPMIAGMAVLVRQWLAQNAQPAVPNPSAALIKAMLLNGATNISPGQYGTGSFREIPAAWPNNVQGWGRASLPATIGLGGPNRLWWRDNTAGLSTGGQASYALDVAAGQPLRVTLAWTDYPAAPNVARTLVNDLDLEVVLPDGTPLRGNNTGDFPLNPTCRQNGADRCNNVESVEINTPVAGTYTLRVRGQAVPRGPQPFALVAGAQGLVNTPPPSPPTVQGSAPDGGPIITLTWTGTFASTSYDVELSRAGKVLGTVTVTSPGFKTVAEVGSYSFRVRGCNANGCGAYGSAVTVDVSVAPKQARMPASYR